jgi:hypothetical protein
LGLIDPRPELRRYEWANPGDMVHIDTKKPGRIGCPVTGCTAMRNDT